MSKADKIKKEEYKKFAQKQVLEAPYESKRPPQEKRNFFCTSVENEIIRVKKCIKDEKLSWMFENCFPNTLDTTIISENDDETFVITGDIDAMWLRDSTAQVTPYIKLSKTDEKLRKLIAGVIKKQMKLIQLDPYANAFTHNCEESEWKDDFTEMKPYVHERKFEIDSLCYPIRLCSMYYEETNDDSVFDDNFVKSCHLILQTFKEQQIDNRASYSFRRRTDRQFDTVCNDGLGAPMKPCGLIRSFFRPSDDSTVFPFLVPSNFMAVKSLKQMSYIFSNVLKIEKQFSDECLRVADEVNKALMQFAIVNHPNFGKIYAYEVDGFGNCLLSDDANVPSLLSLPYISEVSENDEVYVNTRKFVWSESNPYFFKGTDGEGIGGPHIGLDYAWPLSLIMKALTSHNDKEIKECIKLLRNTDANTGFMHESFQVNNSNKYTRPWFAWANTLFGELLIKIVDSGKMNLLESF